MDYDDIDKVLRYAKKVLLRAEHFWNMEKYIWAIAKAENVIGRLCAVVPLLSNAQWKKYKDKYDAVYDAARNLRDDAVERLEALGQPYM